MTTETTTAASERKLLTEDVAAEYLGVRPATIRAWRGERKFLRFLKIGGAVRYRRSDLDEFLNGQVVEPVA